MSRQQAIIAAVVILALALIFSLVFGKASCVSELTTRIGGLLDQLGGIEECEDGIDNDGDHFADINGTAEGYLGDEKCSALNSRGEKTILDLQTSARVPTEGGTIHLGNFRISFPSGALPQETEIQIRRIPHQSQNVLSLRDIYDVTPTGLLLQQPALIHLHINPDDSAPSGPLAFFTEDSAGNRLWIRESGLVYLGDKKVLMGYISTLSKKGVATWEELDAALHSRPASGKCFVGYQETTCPDAALCHGGLRGNVPCSTCPIVPGGDFCCICPPEFSDSDFPCGNDAAGNPLQPPVENCTPRAFDLDGEKCPDAVRALPKIIPDEPAKGAATVVSIEPRISPADRAVSISIRRVADNRFCASINLRGAEFNISMTAPFPHWPGASASPSCERAWDRFIAELQAHERRHAEIALEAVEWLRNEPQNPERWPVICRSTEQEARSAAEGHIDSFIESKADQALLRIKENNARFHQESPGVAPPDCSQCP